MPKFIITAKDMSGQSVTEILEAGDSDLAVQKVQSKGLFITSVKKMAGEGEPVEALGPKPAHVRKFTHSNIKLNDILSFARQLATMIEAGVPLLRSLNVIADQLESRELTRIMGNVIRSVEGGQPFSQALSKHPKVFSPFWISLVEVGEASGTMPKVLERVTLYMEEESAFRSTIIGSMIYPGVLFTICMLAICVFALVIGPVFERIFKDMNMVLPPITALMMGIFKFIKQDFFLIVAGMAAVFFVVKSYVSAGVGRRQFEALLFGLPVFGKMVKLIVVEKFTSQMAILVDSGVPILYALEISERLVDNVVCAKVIEKVREGVREGRLLAEPMEKSGFFPSMAVQMIRVGEETGELSQMLNHVAVYYKKQIQDFLKGFSVLIEPVMLVVMGGIIGTMVLAMFLPILSMSTGG